MLNDRNFKWLISFIIISFSLVFLTGCAEMVTGPKPLAGNSLYFEVNFAEKFDSAPYKYYFIYSKQAIKFDLNYYLFVPGDTDVYNINETTVLPSTLTANVNNVINFYYQNYFSTWSDCLKINSNMQPNTVLIVYNDTNYFPPTANTTVHDRFIATEPSGYLRQDGTGEYIDGFSFQINFSQLRNAPSIGDTFYFSLLVVDQNNKLIESIGSFIVDQLGNQLNVSDVLEQDILGNLDVLNWRVVIQ